MRLPLALRRPLSALLRPVPVRIRKGPNAGCRWSLAASGRHVRGDWERERVEAVLALVSPGERVWDAGAHHGYMTVAMSRRIGPEGRLWAFEPSAYNLQYLRRHVRWNRLANAEVVPCALGREDGTARFGGTGSSQSFHLGGGSETVEVRSVPTLLSQGIAAPDLLKVDVEGAEGEVIESAAPHLSAEAAAVVAIHSLDAYRRVTAALAGRGFRLLESVELRDLRERGAWGTHDPDLLAVGPGRTGLLERARRLPYFAS